MSLLKSGVLSFMRALAGVVGQERSARIAGMVLGKNFLVESVETVKVPGAEIKFYALGEIAQWRVRTFFSKEAETLAWLDRIGADEVLWDVGANMGLYTMYGAGSRKARVLAFEPSAANYFLLNRSIEMSGLSETVEAYCLAISDGDGLSSLNMQNTELAGALSSFGVCIDAHGRSFVPAFKQGMVGLAIDTLVEKFGAVFPNHIKIDVDGIEDRVIRGARKTLSDSRLKSVSIELNDKLDNSEIMAVLNDAGLILEARFHSEDSFYNCHFRR